MGLPVMFIISLVVQGVMYLVSYYFATYLLFTLIKNLHMLYNSLLITSVSTVWVLYVHFTALFNYYMAVNVDPGRSTDVPI